MATQSFPLAVKLKEFTKCYHGLGSEFLPRDALQNLVNEENVRSMLGIQDGTWSRACQTQNHLTELSLVRLITEEARAIFAILVILKQSVLTENLLIEEGLRDEHLPLSIDHEYSYCTSYDGQRKIPFVNCPQEDLVEFVNHKQWFFLAPVLKANGETIKLHEKCPLPFIDDNDEDPSRGGGGLVYRARVHPAHQEGFEVETTELRVAVKEFHRKELFQQENKILQQIKDLRHAHVIRHLMSIESGERKAYSIFPWTDGGTLQDFWRTPMKELTQEHVLWALQQMHGLVSALQALHAVFKCRHGDLKPQNILCFGKDDKITFKIADFGISKIHDMPTMYRKVATTNLAFTASYQGPEIEFERAAPNDQQPRSRKYDIWSLGCVFLEFSVWLLHGPEAMAEFDIARETSGSSLYEVTDREQKQARVHHLANGTVDALLNDPRCTGRTGLAELLNIIADRMLKTDVSERASADEIVNAISDMINRYQRGVLSLFNPHPASDIPQLPFDRTRRN
ncbi:hypothetical protein PFICI_12591 [Pestalotiopsis fici W106-1]|uniref:Protein kinase domain-containing protein n=1 Tax=Pestalotiopsis fici (strain W106-1 / CGMCC3.15140) TaxID=1229662 RepID=W3WR71_PESFW|nr:uncharacterized protein PFICI_12591 [Pestalotiopsis fici W106-1]ETS75647.1 hypothetical protein PFICI_12591 [Pestalotiopsis fici W106-1]